MRLVGEGATPMRHAHLPTKPCATVDCLLLSATVEAITLIANWPTGSLSAMGMFHQFSEGALQKMLHTPGVTTSSKWPSGSRK